MLEYVGVKNQVNQNTRSQFWPNIYQNMTFKLLTTCLSWKSSTLPHFLYRVECLLFKTKIYVRFGYTR